MFRPTLYQLTVPAGLYFCGTDKLGNARGSAGLQNVNLSLPLAHIDGLNINLHRLGGSMFYKLIQRALPGWFPYNSLHVMQPMFIRAKNEEIARELGTIDLYTLDPPSPPKVPVVLMDHTTISAVLKDQASFKIPWLKALNEAAPKGREYSTFMLGGDKVANTVQRNLVGDIIYGPVEFKKLLANAVASYGSRFLGEETFKYTGTDGVHQIDILREYVVTILSLVMAQVKKLTSPQCRYSCECPHPCRSVLARPEDAREPPRITKHRRSLQASSQRSRMGFQQQRAGDGMAPESLGSRGSFYSYRIHKRSRRGHLP